MELGWIMAIFFIVITMVFVVIAFFLPEWVGITGNKAKEIMGSQTDENSPENSKKP